MLIVHALRHPLLFASPLCHDGSIVYLHQRGGALPIVGGESCGGLCLFLRVRLVAQLLDSGGWSVVASTAPRCGFLNFSPALVHLALVVCVEVGFTLKPFCALFAIPVAEAWQVLGSLCVLEMGEVLLVAQVGVDLVEIARVAARLLLRLFSSYGWHGGGGSFWQGGRGFGSQSVGLAGTCGQGRSAERPAVERAFDLQTAKNFLEGCFGAWRNGKCSHGLTCRRLSRSDHSCALPTASQRACCACGALSAANQGPGVGRKERRTRGVKATQALLLGPGDDMATHSHGGASWIADDDVAAALVRSDRVPVFIYTEATASGPTRCVLPINIAAFFLTHSARQHVKLDADDGKSQPLRSCFGAEVAIRAARPAANQHNCVPH